MARWDVQLVSTMDAAGEPWAAIVKISYGTHTILIEVENDDGEWRAEVLRDERERN